MSKKIDKKFMKLKIVFNDEKKMMKINDTIKLIINYIIKNRI